MLGTPRLALGVQEVGTVTRSLIAGSLLLLTGCVHQYAKVGVTPEDATRARAWCEMRKPPIEQPFMDNCMASQGFVVAR